MLVVDPRFDIHESADSNEIELRFETASSILDDTSTLAGSVLYTGGSDTSTVQGESQLQVIEDFNDDDIMADEVMKHFDNTIKQHYDDDENSNKSVSNSGTPSKSIESENNGDYTTRLAVRNISRQNSQEQRVDKVLSIFKEDFHFFIVFSCNLKLHTE